MIYLPLIGYVLLVAIVSGLPVGLFTRPIRIRKARR